MLINQTNLEAIYYNFNALFKGAQKPIAPWYSRIASEVKSTTESERYPWAGNIPRMRKWIGERLVRNLSTRVTALVNEDYELTVGIPRNKLEDDTYGIFRPQLENIGVQAKKWKDQMLTTVLKAGESALAWDGQFFFDTDHPVNIDDASMGTFANLYTAKPLTAPNLDLVRSSFRALKGDNGELLDLNPNLLIVPPQLETTAKQLLNAEIIAPAGAFGINGANGMQTNVLRGSMEVLVIPELADAPLDWYVADVSQPIKPFIVQVRKEPTEIALTNPTDPNIFWRKEFVYGADARGAAGFGLPFLIAKAKG